MAPTKVQMDPGWVQMDPGKGQTFPPYQSGETGGLSPDHNDGRVFDASNVTAPPVIDRRSSRSNEVDDLIADVRSKLPTRLRKPTPKTTK